MRTSQRFRSSSAADCDWTDMRPIDDYFAPLKRKASGNSTSPTSELVNQMTKLSRDGDQNVFPLQIPNAGSMDEETSGVI